MQNWWKFEQEEGLSKLNIHCKGGSGGGGSASGKVDYPDYMKAIHEDWMHQTSDVIDVSVTDTMNAALGNSPFSAATAYDPDTEVASMLSSADDLQDMVTLLGSNNNEVDDLASIALSNSNEIADAVSAYSDILSDEVDTNILPKFEAGMRNINAVQSSAFVIGRAIIAETELKEVARFTANLSVQDVSEVRQASLQLISTQMQYQSTATQYIVESNRIKVVAKGEENKQNFAYDEQDGLWDLEVFKYGGNLMGTIAGSAVSQGSEDGGSKTASALGGALSGAAAGAAFGPMGAGVGAAVGIASAFL